MSGSPKYTRVTIAQSVQQDLLAQLARQAEQARQRRIAEAERVRHERLEAERRRRADALKSVASLLAEPTRTRVARYEGSRRCEAWQEQLRAIGRRIETSGDVGAIREAAEEAERIGVELRAAIGRAEDLDQRRDLGTRRLADLERRADELRQLAGEAVGRHVEDSTPQLEQARQALDLARDEARLDAVHQQLFELREALGLQREQAIESAALARISRALEGLGATDSARFDRPGYERVKRLISEADRHLQARRGDAAHHTLAQAEAELERHRALVEAGRAQLAKLLEIAREALDRSEDERAGLEADERVQRWHATELRAITDRLAALRAEVESGRVPAQLDATLKGLSRDAEAMLERARERQEREARREYIRQSLVAAFQESGFEVSAGPEGPAPIEGDEVLHLHAVRADGGTIDVRMAGEERLAYEVSGAPFPKHAQADLSGNTHAHCDAAAEQIEAVHAILQERFGVESDGLVWEGKLPEGRAAERAAHAAPALRVRRLGGR